MQLYEVMRSTFAARDFTDDPLPDDVIFEILDNARFAPSGGNRQGNKVIIARDRESRAQLAKIVEPAAKKYIAQTQLGESPWNTIVPSKVTSSQIEQAVVPEMLFDQYKSAQVVLVFLVNLELVASMDSELDRVGVISGASIYPFVWNVLMAARQLGFAGSITRESAGEKFTIRSKLEPSS